MDSDILYRFVLAFMIMFIVFVVGVRISVADAKEQPVEDRGQLEGLYAKAMNTKKAKQRMQRIQDNPRMFLYWYGESQGLELWEVQQLERIAQCESRWNPSAQNPNSSASGLFQIINSTFSAYGSGNVFDPVDNIKAAINLYKYRGFQPWQCKG